MSIELRVLDSDGAGDPQSTQAIMADLKTTVESVDYLQISGENGSKSSSMIPDLTALVVAVLSSKAAGGLESVIKAYIKRNEGSVIIKRKDGSEARITAGNIATLRPEIGKCIDHGAVS